MHASQEAQFIVKYAKLFGTQAGDIYQVDLSDSCSMCLAVCSCATSKTYKLRHELSQVIDTQQRKLQNVITFPPCGMFVVESSIDPEPESQRTNFQFSGASLTVNLRKFKVPPFGKGWCVRVVRRWRIAPSFVHAFDCIDDAHVDNYCLQV